MRRLQLFVIALIAVFAITACDSGKESMQEEIEALENSLFNDPQAEMNQDSARLLIEHYVQYADNYPEDSLAINYLFKAARVDIALNDVQAGLKRLNRIEAQYPESHHMPKILLLRGIIYEDELKDYNKAGKEYQRLVDEYPENEFADDARLILKNLGKSPEELIEEFERKQAEQDSLAVANPS